MPYYDWWSEALHGVAAPVSPTSFPQSIGLAATWDTGFMQQIGDAISTEARAKYHRALPEGIRTNCRGLTFLSPNINLVRDPRWGRGQETYGEDPYLTGIMASAFIRGMQGADPHYLKTIATRSISPSTAGQSRRGIASTPSYQSRISTTHIWRHSARCSVCRRRFGHVRFQRGQWSSGLRLQRPAPGPPTGRLGLQRIRGQRFGAIDDIATAHKYAPGIPEALALAVRAGTDLICCGSESAQLSTAVSRGLITQAEIDRSVIRLFTARFRLGMFDPPERVPYAAIPYSAVDSQANRNLALRAAEESIVLLKNANGILPLSPAIKKIAVVGPAADWPDMQLGNYYGTPSHIVTPLAGIRQRFGATAEVRYAIGGMYTKGRHVLARAAGSLADAGTGALDCWPNTLPTTVFRDRPCLPAPSRGFTSTGIVKIPPSSRPSRATNSPYGGVVR